MQFQSAGFLLFFAVLVLLYRFLPGKFRKGWLLACSLFFCLSFGASSLLILLLVIVFGFAAGIWLENADSPASGKRRLTIPVAGLVLILCLFKYADFLLENVNTLLSAAGWPLLPERTGLFLPVGISFYLFQTIGYLVDVYRKDSPAEKNFFTYALFVCFFPQITAGPIARSSSLLPQLRNLSFSSQPTQKKSFSGFSLMLWGFFLKMVLSDRAGIFVDAVWQNLFACGTSETVLAAILFSFQIYADFAGYSSIAIGAARILGIDLMENFHAPYLSGSIAQFWRRWHISLSTWLRDYVYIPLGGNRKGQRKKYRNLLVTFLVSGIWHGASWSFVIWGLLHGVYQVLGSLLGPLHGKACRLLRLRKDTFSFRLLQVLWTFLLVSFAWIFFRAGSLSNAFFFLNRMLTRWDPWVLFNEQIFAFGLDRQEIEILFLSILVLAVIDLLQQKKGRDFGALLASQSLWFRWGLCLVLIVLVLVVGEYGIDFSSSQFIYAGF